MHNTLSQYMKKNKKDKRRKYRLLSILLLLSLIVSTEVFWSLRQKGIAMAGDADCGIVEHTHTKDCGEVCAIFEHTHTLSCYSDDTRDVESKADWELSVCGLPFTEDLGSDLLAAAKTQLGYTESEANFRVDEAGERNGYTRYGAWYGNPYGKWSGMFVSFCLYYSGIPIGAVPMYAGAETMRSAWEESGLYTSSLMHTAAAGDIVFLDTDGDGMAEHTGIVSRAGSDTLGIIAGDLGNSVEEIDMERSDGKILGFGDTSAILLHMAQNDTVRVVRSVTVAQYLSTLLAQKTSDSQIINYGGYNAASDGTKVSKTIAGTDIENIFDITLTVETQQRIQQIYKEPDMAVVIVMDISNTMNAVFGDSYRYTAAMEAASDFIYHFAETAGDVSKIGYVAFNTNAYKIFDLQNCNTKAGADALIKEMKADTKAIIGASGYSTSSNRFTNIEAGLKMGWDMIKNTNQEHKYVIFLSDGFPTTYLKNHNGTDYKGYNPQSGSGTPGRDGVFYDAVWKKYLDSGTSYSDKGAVYARQAATKIKNEGGTIFSIGIDIGGQTINNYLYDANGNRRYHVVDRMSTTYEIGSATNASSYKNWLKNSIGSGYYYDSTNTQGLKDAYEAIFSEIQHLREEESKAEWIACDPLPIMEDSSFKTVEFIGFYEKNGTFVPMSTSATLNGSHVSGAENTATFLVAADQIDWDLKNSGFTSTSSAGLTTFKYELKYRVRLRVEDSAFEEYNEYHTNDITTLSYRIIETVNGEVIISDTKSINFPLPSVEGYLGELEFTKVDPHGAAVAGAEFTLSHDKERCLICHGDGTSTQTVPDYIAVSDDNGIVSFINIPSGHKYTLTETKIPDGYLDTGRKYRAEVAYDTTTANAATGTGAFLEWDGTILNNVPFDLPATGGDGHMPYIIIGSALISIALPLIVISCLKGKRKE